MRKWTPPEHMVAQMGYVRQNPDAMPNGYSAYVRNLSGSDRVSVRFGHKPWPAFEIRVGGKTVTVDSEELMNWLRMS